jgi:predicted nucleic acid-binding protein
MNERKLDEIIRLLEIRVMDVTRSVASEYGLIYLSLIKKGRKIPILS